MATVPDKKSLIQAVYARGSYDLSTKEGCGDFTRAAAMALYEDDNGFGELLKPSGRNHVIDRLGRRVAVDAVLYLPAGTSVDIISSSETAKAKPSFTRDSEPRYSAKDWAEPAGLGATPPPVDEPDQPTPPNPPTPAPIDSAILETLARQIADLGNALAKTNAWLGEVDAKVNATTPDGPKAYHVIGTTSREWGHAHSLNVTIEEI